MSGAAFDRTTPATMIDLRYVKKLIEILDESTVDSIEISSDKGMKIRLSKSPNQRGAVTMQAPMLSAPDSTLISSASFSEKPTACHSTAP